MRGRRRWVMIGAIVLLAAGLRDWAARSLPLDFDEPVYAQAGLAYAAAIRAGDTDLLAGGDPAPEHPGLMKLLYAAVFVRFPPLPPDLPQGDPAAFEAWAADPANQPWLEPMQAMIVAARRASVFFGAAHVLLLALISPAAGALLAVHTYSIKYTAQIYLEALPMFMATVAVLAYGRAGRNRPFLWWGLSAGALGLAAAGKYVYAVAGLAIAADYLWPAAAGRPWRGLRLLLGWGGLALLVFYAANPYLWADPMGRLADSLRFHAAYAQGAHVARSGYPWWQPLVWLFTSQPATWHPGIIVTALDMVSAVLGVIGLPFMWRAWGGRGRVIVLWWGIGVVFLLIWPTKWPQYSLIMTAPMCLCAAEALRWAWSRLPEEMWGTGN